MGNCGSIRRPDPKAPSLNICGDYELKENGRGYTTNLKPGSVGTNSDYKSNFIKSDGYCIPAGLQLGGDTNYHMEHDKYCRSIGDTNKDGKSMWEIDPNNHDGDHYGSTNAKGCFSSNENGYTEMNDLGCCDGYCASDGIRPYCLRNNDNFSGNPLVCCFSDYKINSINDEDINNPASCYEDKVTKQRTCHPDYRDLGASECNIVVKDYCTGKKVYTWGQ